MSNVVQLNSEDKRLEEVSEWIAKMDRGLDQTEQAEIKRWMGRDQRNAETLTRMAGLWDKMDALQQLADTFPHTPKDTRRAKTPVWAIAASILFLSALGVALWQSPFISQSDLVAQRVISENTYSTDVGESATFYLQDKTKVVLNTDSQLKVTYTDKQRLFELQQGELHVTVAHNKAQPLSVFAAGKLIQAVGTAFNVEIKNSEVELLVTDGKVLVAEKGDVHSALEVTNVHLPVSSLAVSKGEKVALGSAQQQVLKLENDEIRADLSWQQGNLVFRGESLESAMREVSRYTNYEFELADSGLKQIQIAGLFKTGDVNGLLDALEQNFNVRHQRVGSNTIRLRLASSPI